jgi:hypothetical protein
MSDPLDRPRSIAPPGAIAGAPPTDWLVEEDEEARKASQARAKLASDVTVALERTLKSFRQFGVRHKTSQGFIEDAVRRVAIFTEQFGELPLSVVGSDILFDGESIYSDPELRTSYPFLLFRDGVQRVVFERGVEAIEIATFCSILRDQSLLGTNVAMEDDLVTLLWDADLRHVRYVINESFKQEDVDQQSEAQRQRLIAQLRADALADGLDPALSARFVRPPKDKEIERAKDDLAVAAAWERGNQIAANEQARAALAKQVDADDVLLRKFLEIVFLEILGQKDPKVRVELIKLVRDFAVEAARRDRLAEAIGVLKALGDLARMAGGEGRKVAQEILGAIATPELLAELMHQLQIADDAGTEQLLTFLALVPPKESRALVPHLGTLTTTSRRRAVCQLLAERLGDDLAAVGEQIRDAESGLALDLVYLLKQSPATRAKVELLTALDHLDPMVRRAAYDAIRSGVPGSDPVVLGASLLSLDDADPELRRAALFALPRVPDADVARRLRTIISRDGFDDWDYGDKRRAYLLYAAAAGRKAGKELVEVVVTRTVFSNDALDDRRCCAAFALASLGDEAHLGVLESEAKRIIGASKRLKEACEASIAILKFKKPLEIEQAPAVALVGKDDVEVLPTAHLPKPIWEDLGTAATVIGGGIGGAGAAGRGPAGAAGGRPAPSGASRGGRAP